MTVLTPREMPRLGPVKFGYPYQRQPGVTPISVNMPEPLISHARLLSLSGVEEAGRSESVTHMEDGVAGSNPVRLGLDLPVAHLW